MLEQLLHSFCATTRFRGKGPLSVALVVTDHARNLGLPLDSNNLLTSGGGQVLGLGIAKVQSILARHDITRVLAREGGRTSRGSIGNMRSYVAFLNNLQLQLGDVEIDDIERFWIERIKEFFASKPFILRMDSSLGLRAVIRNLMAQAVSRQQELPGTMFLGTLMQHLVGAKLDLILATGSVAHHSANESDQSEERTGDFDLGDVSIHVTTAPSEALIRRCEANLYAGRKPIIITNQKGVATADGLASNFNLADRIDIIEFEQFIATNIYELGQFSTREQTVKVTELIERYNAIVTEHETDPSLRIDLAGGK